MGELCFYKDFGTFQKELNINLYLEPDPARCFTVRGKGVLKNQGDITSVGFNVCAPTILDKNKMVEYLKVVIK